MMEKESGMDEAVFASSSEIKKKYSFAAKTTFAGMILLPIFASIAFKENVFIIATILAAMLFFIGFSGMLQLAVFYYFKRKEEEKTNE